MLTKDEALEIALNTCKEIATGLCAQARGGE